MSKINKQYFVIIFSLWKTILMKLNITAKMKNYFLILATITLVFGREECPEKTNRVCGSNPPSCKRSRYRSYDGSCNNLIHPSWGSANKEYDRFVPAFYADGKFILD